VVCAVEDEGDEDGQGIEDVQRPLHGVDVAAVGLKVAEELPEPATGATGTKRGRVAASMLNCGNPAKARQTPQAMRSTTTGSPKKQPIIQVSRQRTHRKMLRSHRQPIVRQRPRKMAGKLGNTEGRAANLGERFRDTSSHVYRPKRQSCTFEQRGRRHAGAADMLLMRHGSPPTTPQILQSGTP